MTYEGECLHCGIRIRVPYKETTGTLETERHARCPECGKEDVSVSLDENTRNVS